MTNVWTWISLTMFILSLVIFGIFIALYYRQPANRRSTIYLWLWIISLILAIIFLMLFIATFFYREGEEENKPLIGVDTEGNLTYKEKKYGDVFALSEAMNKEADVKTPLTSSSSPLVRISSPTSSPSLTPIYTQRSSLYQTPQQGRYL